MAPARLKSVGNTVVVPLTPEVLHAMGLKAEDEVDLTLTGGCLLVESPARRHHRLQDLIEEEKKLQNRRAQHSDWLTEKPRGRESL